MLIIGQKWQHTCTLSSIIPTSIGPTGFFFRKSMPIAVVSELEKKYIIVYIHIKWQILLLSPHNGIIEQQHVSHFEQLFRRLIHYVSIPQKQIHFSTYYYYITIQCNPHCFSFSDIRWKFPFSSGTTIILKRIQYTIMTLTLTMNTLSREYLFIRFFFVGANGHSNSQETNNFELKIKSNSKYVPTWRNMKFNNDKNETKSWIKKNDIYTQHKAYQRTND